jgi:hypothetical protein
MGRRISWGTRNGLARDKVSGINAGLFVGVLTLELIGESLVVVNSWGKMADEPRGMEENPRWSFAPCGICV